MLTQLLKVMVALLAIFGEQEIISKYYKDYFVYDYIPYISVATLTVITPLIVHALWHKKTTQTPAIHPPQT